MKSIIWAKLPRAGLGNKLLVWADAYILAQKTGLPLITTGWIKIHVGPIIRREKNKRLYFREVKITSLWQRIRLRLAKLVLKKITTETATSQQFPSNKLIVFNNYPHYSVWFKSIAQNIESIKTGIEGLIHPSVVKIIKNEESPFIAIHIRMADFKKVDSEEEYMTTWVARTPLTYFINVIYALRIELKWEVPVTIFSDGHENELTQILNLSNVKLHQSQKDIADILIMSKSKILITSQGSSFSYWAAALSTNIIIHHFKDDSEIRNKEINCRSFEGHLLTDKNNYPILPNLLKQNLSNF